MFCIGALPFIFCAHTYAREAKGESQEPRAESREAKRESKWLDDYKKPVGFTYGVDVRVQANYLWRGLYAGGFNLQADANVGYGGLYLDMWWNIGATDWTFSTFQPELDLSLGFSRWGLNIYALYIHNFNSGFFDFHNYPDKGNRVELNLQYTVSSKLPLSFRWGTRVAASDCYLNAAGDTIRAYSSYAEISYTHHFRDGWSAVGAFGMTPWKGGYNPNGAALQNIEFRLRKDWTVSKRCGMMVQGQIAVSPMALKNVINVNAAVGVYLK